MSDSIPVSEHRHLLEQILEPKTRRTARQKLIAARAVDVLLKCLDSPNESVVWVGVQSLEELRATEAVEPLIDLMDRGILLLDVSEALVHITGQDFGVDVGDWRRWQAGSSKPKPIDAAGCVRRTGEYLGVEPAGSKNSYRFQLALPDDRGQQVAVFFGRQDDAGEELVVIYSECGPANPKHYDAVLRKNMSIPAGAFAVRDIKGTPTLVVVDTMMGSVVTASALAKKIEHIAKLADSVEQSLTQQDTR